MQRNGSGKLYNPSQRFKLVIKILGTQNDTTTRILHRMKKGTQKHYQTLHEAIQSQQEFLKDAKFVANQGILATYGLTTVIDTRDSLAHNTETIMEYKDKTP